MGFVVSSLESPNDEDLSLGILRWKEKAARREDRNSGIACNHSVLCEIKDIITPTNGFGKRIPQR
jgi:hypothetical protein